MLLKLRTIFLFILSISFFQTLIAQSLTSEEKKRIKSQLKQYMKNPEAYKKEQEALVTQMSTWSKKLKDLEKFSANYNAELATKQNEISSLRIVVEGKDKEIDALRNGKSSGGGSSQSACQEGTYKVQIGKFDNFSIASYLDKAKCITYETVGNSLVYTIVGFSDPKEAFNMSQELRRMGLAGAFVTKFVNKNRVDYDHVAETGEKPYYEGGSRAPEPKAAAKPYNPGPTYVNVPVKTSSTPVKKEVSTPTPKSSNSSYVPQPRDNRETDISGDDSYSDEEETPEANPSKTKDDEDSYKEEDPK